MATEPLMTLSQINYLLIKAVDRMYPCQDVRRAQAVLITNDLNKNGWMDLANFNDKVCPVGVTVAKVSNGVTVFPVVKDIGLVRPWQPMQIWKHCVPSSPSRLRLMDNISPTAASATTDVESDLHGEAELAIRRELLRDGVVGPVSLVNAVIIYNYLFKGGDENGKFRPAFTVTDEITYAVSYKHEIEGDAKMSEANFIRIVQTLKAIHPRKPVFIWIDQQLRKCPERDEWVNRGVAPYIAFPTVRLPHHGPERVWIALEKTAAARHYVRVDISSDFNHATLVINSGFHYSQQDAIDAVAGFMCGDLVTTFGITYKSDLVKLRNWAKRRFQSLTTPQLCAVVNYSTRAYCIGGRRTGGWRAPQINCWSPTPLNSIGIGRRADLNYKGQRFVRAEHNCFVLSGKGWRTTAFLVRLDGRHVTQFVTVDPRFAAFLDFAVEEYHMPCDMTARASVTCDNGAIERVGRLLEFRWMTSCELDGVR